MTTVIATRHQTKVSDMRASARAQSSKYEAKREAVMDAAAAIFAEYGYHGASTKLIAERVGIRQGSLYYYFPSKAAALEAVCAKGVSDFIEGLIEIIGQKNSVEDRLRAAILNHLQHIEHKPNYVRTFETERRYLSDPNRKEVRHHVRRYERLTIELFESGVKEGAFDPDLDCELAMLAFFGECNSVFAWYGKRSINRSIEQISSVIADRFIAHATKANRKNRKAKR